MSSKDSEERPKKTRGIWSSIFSKQEESRQASESEVVKAVQTVMRHQAGVLRLLEKE